MEVSIRQALREAASFLGQKGVDSARSEAEVILAFLLGRDKSYLYAHGEEKITRELKAAYKEMLQRRGQGNPLAYITGKKEFMGLTFSVNESVLIPRPETEHLVEAVLDWSKRIFLQLEKEVPLQILDLGTGCGNIAISLAYYLPSSLVTGVDLGKKALELALQNAQSIGVVERVKFLYGNYWEPLSPEEHKFHIVVSNPPYIPRAALPFLSPEVQKEPRLALDGGPDGLDAYRYIFGGIKRHLAKPGLLALEIGEHQAEPVMEMSRPDFGHKNEIIKDYAGLERVLLFSNG
ncbi:MAG: peptide chain release factor N(5)-glutamine methyltransferase [Dethiobacter sp.]|jgi:release factor glutamine methyltransferase|nr:MAG: peptide chain release factor N(5)-glutamine methyltransferase [Dethiobacter sp.]